MDRLPNRLAPNRPRSLRAQPDEVGQRALQVHPSSAQPRPTWLFILRTPGEQLSFQSHISSIVNTLVLLWH